MSQSPISDILKMEECGGDYESEGEGDCEQSQSMDDLLSKRRKLNEDERVQRCRERNRVHARNTRERKRAQMDLLQQRIQELSDEKKALENYEPEESVASILMSLSGSPKSKDKNSAVGTSTKTISASGDDSSKRFAAEAIERIKSEISATLSDDEELEMNSEILMKDKSSCTGADLEMIRRERNRMHAKKTRLRKKKMLSEMESIISGLEQDIRDLRQRHGLGPDEYTSGMDFRRRPAGSLTISGAVGGSKFTGFRHVHRSDSSAPKSFAAPSEAAAHSSSSVSSNGSGGSGGSGIAASFESAVHLFQPALLKATTSPITDGELGVNTNPPFPTLYAQAFSSFCSSLSSKLPASGSGSATTTPALSTSSSSSSGSSSNSVSSGDGCDYQQYAPPSASTESLAGSAVGSVQRGAIKHKHKRSSSELSSGATSRAASMDDLNGPGCGFISGRGEEGGGEQRCAGILYLAATAAAESNCCSSSSQ